MKIWLTLALLCVALNTFAEGNISPASLGEKLMKQDITFKQKVNALNAKKLFSQSIERRCDDDDDDDNDHGHHKPDYSCIPNCTARWGDGSCRSYGSDFCGESPTCVENCTARWGDGSCRSYGADVCY